MFRFSWRLSLSLAAALLLTAEAGRASAQAVPCYAPPAVSYYAPPAVSYYAPPAVSYYAAPTVSYYAAPAVSYYAPPAVSYYAAPATAVTTYRYGLLGRPVVVTRYYR